MSVCTGVIALACGHRAPPSHVSKLFDLAFWDVKSWVALGV